MVPVKRPEAVRLQSLRIIILVIHELRILGIYFFPRVYLGFQLNWPSAA
jgi:hypothetical protein